MINHENAGFARGNNVAYQFAKEKYKPDFMVIMNNDIEIETEEFENRDRYLSEGKIPFVRTRYLFDDVSASPKPKTVDALYL